MVVEPSFADEKKTVAEDSKMVIRIFALKSDQNFCILKSDSKMMIKNDRMFCARKIESNGLRIAVGHSFDALELFWGNKHKKLRCFQKWSSNCCQ